MRFRMLAWLVPLGVVACAYVGSPSLPARQTRTVGEYAIEYSPGDEAYVELLAAQLRDRGSAAVATTEPAPLTVGDLTARRDRLLQRAAEFLGLEKPTDQMSKIYDDFLRMHAELAEQFVPPRKFALWQKAEIIARLKAGEKIPGFALEGETGLTFAFKFNVQHSDEEPSPAPTRAEQVWPIRIREPDAVSPEREIADGVATMMEMRSALLNHLSSSWAFLILHETVEYGEISTYLESADRRWFCDGVANYVASKIIAAEVGPEQARRCYDLAAQLESYASAAPRIDLERWPAAENMAKAGYAEDLNTADYAYATKVIADICAKHGDELLPKLFREMGKTGKSKVTMQTVRAAFRTLTGEDLRSYLPKRPPSGRAGVGT